MIEKDQKTIVNLMLKTTYLPVIQRAVYLSILSELYKMSAQVQVSSDRKLSRRELFEIKRDFMQKLLKCQQVKEDLYKHVDRLYDKRLDLIVEVLRQYGVESGHEATEYIDELSEMFHQVVFNAKSVIKKADYGSLKTMV